LLATALFIHFLCVCVYDANQDNADGCVLWVYVYENANDLYQYQSSHRHEYGRDVRRYVYDNGYV
jgi:hypothetical protein